MREREREGTLREISLNTKTVSHHQNTDISELKEKLFHELPSSTSRERRPPESATNTIRKGTTKRRAAPPPPPK